ncbi:MAG: thiamine-phosphate kinase [Verrucomicrobiae bacterium]|nr:thiamine-phosphate kinase [Verrucomicrobiae bacterium]
MPPDEVSLLKMLTGHWSCSKAVHTGVGDDCAVLHRDRRRLLLLKTDAVVEGRHFSADEKPARIGAKALNRVLSDIAAMGGTPSAAVITVMAPPSLSPRRLKAIYRGLERAAHTCGVDLVGGELTAAPHFALSVAMTGYCSAAHLVLRSGAKCGDTLLVTGRLGGSFASGRHLDFTPRLREAAWLVRHFKPSAMMDLSDGLGADLPRLAAASGLHFQIDLPGLPLHRGCTVSQALAEGEDYELLMAVPARKTAPLRTAWKRRFPKIPLTPIGKFVSLSIPSTPMPHGFDHFRKPQPR